MQIPINCFNSLELEKSSKLDQNRVKFNAYLFGRNLSRHLVAEVEFDRLHKTNSMRIKKRGSLIHPKVLLALNKFIFKYNGQNN